MSSHTPPAECAQLSADALICVVDDDESVRRSLFRLFRSMHFAVEIFASAEDFLKRAPYNGPSCLVLDLHLPGLHGLELQELLAGRNLQIVFLTGEGGVPACVEAMKAGAVDFLTKPVDDEILLAAVNVALIRSVSIRKTSAVRVSARSRLDSLTKRELEVLRLVIAGLLNKQIADELGAAEKTIKIHRGRVMSKMEVSSVAELVRLANIAGTRPATTGKPEADFRLSHGGDVSGPVVIPSSHPAGGTSRQEDVW